MRPYWEQGESPEQAGVRIPGTAQDADDLAGAEVGVEVHHQLRMRVHSNAEGLPATARAAPVRHAGHHLVLLLAAQQQVGWRFDLHSSIAGYQSFGDTMQRAAASKRS